MLGESVRRRQGGRRPRRPRTGKRNLRVWLIGLPLALLVPFAIGYLIAVRVLFPPPPVATAGITVPDLVGRSTTDAQRLLVEAGLGSLEASELPHPSAPAGQVVAQSPLPGQQLRGGAPVQVALSAGRPRVMVPDVLGFSAERAAAMLQRSGFTVSQTTEESLAAPGRVIRTDPEPGHVRELPAHVTLIVSIALPRDTLPPDTSAFGAHSLSLYQGTNWR